MSLDTYAKWINKKIQALTSEQTTTVLGITINPNTKAKEFLTPLGNVLCSDWKLADEQSEYFPLFYRACFLSHVLYNMKDDIIAYVPAGDGYYVGLTDEYFVEAPKLTQTPRLVHPVTKKIEGRLVASFDEAEREYRQLHYCRFCQGISLSLRGIKEMDL